MVCRDVGERGVVGEEDTGKETLYSHINVAIFLLLSPDLLSILGKDSSWTRLFRLFIFLWVVYPVPLLSFLLWEANSSQCGFVRTSLCL